MKTDLRSKDGKRKAQTTLSWYEEMIERAKTFIRTDEGLSPVLFIKKEQKMGIVPLGQFANDKDVLSSLLHIVVQVEDPDEYMYVTEAFVKLIDMKDEGEDALGKLLVDGTLQVSQMPSSKECITILYGDRKSEKLGTIIFEKKDGKVVFEPVRWMEGAELKGRFTGLRSRDFFSDHKSDKSI